MSALRDSWKILGASRSARAVCRRARTRPPRRIQRPPEGKSARKPAGRTSDTPTAVGGSRDRLGFPRRSGKALQTAPVNTGRTGVAEEYWPDGDSDVASFHRGESRQGLVAPARQCLLPTSALCVSQRGRLCSAVPIVPSVDALNVGVVASPGRGSRDWLMKHAARKRLWDPPRIRKTNPLRCVGDNCVQPGRARRPRSVAPSRRRRPGRPPARSIATSAARTFTLSAAIQQRMHRNAGSPTQYASCPSLNKSSRALRSCGTHQNGLTVVPVPMNMPCPVPSLVKRTPSSPATTVQPWMW
jgi:hypothetical protein